jgi:hypothetical protein
MGRVVHGSDGLQLHGNKRRWKGEILEIGDAPEEKVGSECCFFELWLDGVNLLCDVLWLLVILLLKKNMS